MPYLGDAKINHKRFSIGVVWDDVSNFASNICTLIYASQSRAYLQEKNAVGAAKWAGGVSTSAVAKAGVMKVANGVKTWWSGTTSASSSDATMALNDVQGVVADSSEAISDATADAVTAAEGASAEDLVFGALAAAKLRKRDGTNCTSSSCAGAMFSSFATYHGLARLYHAIVGSIYSFNATNVLSEATQDVAGLFFGIENSWFGDSRGRILHGYGDEMVKHGVSRLRLADVNYLPKTSMLINLVPATNQTSGESRLTAVDINGGKGYHLITCAYPHTLPKVFIGNDFELGPISLVQSAVSDLVQGLEPRWCATVPYTYGVTTAQGDAA